jgi:hypothetical protein
MTFTTSSMLWLYPAVGAYAGSLLFYLMKWQRISLAILVAGFVAHSAAIIARGWYFGVFTPVNFFTEQYFLPWCLAALALCLKIRVKDAPTAMSLLFPICFFSLTALLLPASMPQPSPTTASVYAVIFFLFEVLAHALFVMGGWFAAMFLLGRAEASQFNIYAVWGFILFSIAQVVGGVWSYLGWTVPFHWSERHLVSACLWCFYCAYLHLHFSARWSAKNKARFAIGGAVIMLAFTYAYYLGSLGVKHA